MKNFFRSNNSQNEHNLHIAKNTYCQIALDKAIKVKKNLNKEITQFFIF